MKPISVDDAARVVHAANREYRKAIGEDPGPAWEDAPQEMKESAIHGVVQYQLNPLATPEYMHGAWRKHKLAQGWVYGPEKDEAKKTHPCLVAYDALPEEQRYKDSLFIAILRVIAPLIGLPPSPVPAAAVQPTEEEVKSIERAVEKQAELVVKDDGV